MDIVQNYLNLQMENGVYAFRRHVPAVERVTMPKWYRHSQCDLAYALNSPNQERCQLATLDTFLLPLDL